MSDSDSPEMKEYLSLSRELDGYTKADWDRPSYPQLDALLDQMEFVWWRLTKDEQDFLNEKERWPK